MLGKGLKEGRKYERMKERKKVNVRASINP
jgi:hypothetical protein